jgi:hypothetical protein
MQKEEKKRRESAKRRLIYVENRGLQLLPGAAGEPALIGKEAFAILGDF